MSREEIKNKVIRIIDDTVNVNLDSFQINSWNEVYLI